MNGAVRASRCKIDGGSCLEILHQALHPGGDMKNPDDEVRACLLLGECGRLLGCGVGQRRHGARSSETPRCSTPGGDRVGQIATGTALLALGYLSDPRCGGGRQGRAGHSSGGFRPCVAVYPSRSGMAGPAGGDRRPHRSPPARCERPEHDELPASRDVTRLSNRCPPACRTRGAVHPLGRGVCRDSPWQTGWARGWRTAPNRERPAHATHQVTSTETRRSIVLVVHDSAQSWKVPANGWTPKGLCAGS